MKDALRSTCLAILAVIAAGCGRNPQVPENTVAAAFGFLVFGQVPDLLSCTGIAAIVAMGVWMNRKGSDPVDTVD